MEKGTIGSIRTPKPLNRLSQKFGMGDYVGDMAQQAKIQTDRPSGGVPGASRKMGEISLSRGF